MLFTRDLGVTGLFAGVGGKQSWRALVEPWSN